MSDVSDFGNVAPDNPDLAVFGVGPSAQKQSTPVAGVDGRASDPSRRAFVRRLETVTWRKNAVHRSGVQASACAPHHKPYFLIKFLYGCDFVMLEVCSRRCAAPLARSPARPPALPSCLSPWLSARSPRERVL